MNAKRCVLYYYDVEMIVTFPVGSAVKIECFCRGFGKMGSVHVSDSACIDCIHFILDGSENAGRDLYSLCCRLGIAC